MDTPGLSLGDLSLVTPDTYRVVPRETPNGRGLSYNGT